MGGTKFWSADELVALLGEDAESIEDEGVAGDAKEVECPACGHRFNPKG
jgi:hypothetical protein